MESFGSFWRRRRLGKLCRPSAATCVGINTFSVSFAAVVRCLSKHGYEDSKYMVLS